MDEEAGQVDRRMGLKNAAGDETFYRQLTSSFLEDHASDGRRIRDALKAGDTARAHRLAHTLKSTAELIGARKLRVTALLIERRLAEGETDLAVEQMRRLDVELNAVLNEIRPAQESSVAPRAEKPLDKKRARELIEKLTPLLKSGDTKSFELAGEIRETFSPFGEKCELLVKQMEDFEFERASEILSSLRERVKD
jgi:HPt (histidine-containing phosphotransfer) domain-containing protein